MNLADLTVDECIVKAPCGGQAAGTSPVDRGKQGTKRSVLTDGTGIPLGVVVNWHQAVELDVGYVENWSIGLDLSILPRRAQSTGAY